MEGLIFGITEVTTAVQNKQCSAMIVESSVNPRTIILPLIEQCIDARIPTLCLNGLRKSTSENFGIPTSCLGVKCDCLVDLKAKICQLVKHYSPPQISKNVNNDTSVTMEVHENKDRVVPVSTTCPYLYRTNKKTRVFNPSLVESKAKTEFGGQDFIEFSNKPKQKSDNKAYMNMILRKISSNQNRVKRKNNL